MNNNLRELANLLKEGKAANQTATKDVVLDISASTDLKSFLTEIAQNKRQQKEELREKAVDVIPKLGDFFGLLVDSKKPITEIVSDDIKKIDTTDEKVSEKIEEVSSVVDNISQVSDYIDKNKDVPIATFDNDDVIELKKLVADLDAKLKKEVANLKQLISSSSKTIVHQTSGGGEVLFSRLDDVSLFNVQHDDVIVFDATLQKFINKRIDLTGSGIPGGTKEQVLVKISNTDYDYEWQDMQIKQQVYTKLIDDSIPSIVYIGEAIPGTGTSSPNWRISKIIFDTNANVDAILYANNGNFDQVWINRYSITFS